MKTTRFLMAAFLALTVSSGWCQTYTNSFTGLNATVPNGKLTGWSDTRRIKLAAAGLATNVQVTVTLSGGFNGDLYGYLVHGSGFTVMLNRPGRVATNVVGYADAGVDVTFSGGPLNDVHLYQDFTGPVSPLTGNWNPDARQTDPLSTLGTDSRTAHLSSFTGVNPTGDWTLFLADVDGGGTATTVTSWSLIISIDPAPVPLNFAAIGVNKAYDGTNTATVNFTDDRGAGDVLTYTCDASFSDKFPGNGKAVSVSNIVLGGADASRYVLVTNAASTTANITQVPLTVTGITASDKQYDGNTSAAINTGGATLVGVLGGESVTLNTGGATGAFSDKNVGNGKTVQISGLTISGADAGNYAVVQPTTTANISQASLNVSANGTLVYGRDPSNAVYTPTYYPLLGSDTAAAVSGSANFSTDATATNYVGSNYIVTVVNTGTLSAQNYSFAAGSNGVMTITPAPLTATNAIANNKVYDGNATATFNVAGAGLNGLKNGDSVTLDSTGVSAAFSNSHAGVGKTVQFSGFAIVGSLGTNYSLAQPTTTATISPRVASLTGSSVYSGTTTVAASALTVANNLDGGNLNLSGTARVNSRNVGTQSLILTNYATPTRVQGAAVDGGTGTTTVWSAAYNNFPVDGNTLVAVIATRGTAGQRVSSISQIGANWSRVVEASNTTSTIEIWYAPNVSGASRNVTFNLAQSLRSAAMIMEYSGVLASGAVDRTASATNRSTSAVTGTTLATTLANELWVGGIGFTNNNYSLSSVLNSFSTIGTSATANATVANNAKVYALEFIANATGTASSGGTINTQSFWAGAIATFKAQDSTALTLTGSAAGDYTLVGASGSVTITTAPLTVTAQANTKVYDRTTSATNAPTITAGTVKPGDTAPTWTETYDTRHVGTGKTLSPVPAAINDGNAGANYSVTFANNVNGVISVKPITVTALTNTKVYDGNTSAAAVPSVSPAVISGDTANFIETYDNANVGTGKTLTPSGSVADGNGGGNYNVSFANNLTGVIKPACSQTNSFLSVVDNNNGTLTLTLVGTLQSQYYVVSSQDATASLNTWQPVAGSTNLVTNPNGVWQVTVTNNGSQQYYRGVSLVPCP